MISRLARKNIENALSRQAAVAIIGPRQVGKTTLALEVGEARNAVYLDLEDSEDRSKLESPALFFGGLEDRLVILDEIHRMPEIFQTLRGVIDKGRRKQKGKGRFLILGSASIDLLQQSSESLAGRISYVEMGGLTLGEVGRGAATRDRLWLRGGFPEMFLADSDAMSLAARKDFIRTYLERDIPIFGPRVPAQTMERLWTMLAHQQGTMLNGSEIARALEVSAQSVTRYLDLLCDLLLARRVQPYFANVGKRLVKSPKVYVRDSGLVHALLGIEDLIGLAGHPVVGRSWEGFAIEQILAAGQESQAFFYRTAAGAEVDLLLEQKDGSLWAIEVKRSGSGRLTKGFYHAIQDLKPARAMVVYAGEDRYPLHEGVEAVGLGLLVEELRGEGVRVKKSGG